MEGGETEPEEPIDEPSPETPIDEPIGEPSPEVPLASRFADTWSINWGGAIGVAVALVVLVIVVQQRGGDDSSGAAGAASSTVPVTTVPITTPRPTVATTTTTPPPTTTATTVPRRQVLIRGEVKPCRFGSECLAAHFEIRGFDPHPGRFTCIYPNSRRDFGFNDDEVIDACLSGDEGDTIAIEVDGVVSATISAEHLEGEP